MQETEDSGSAWEYWSQREVDRRGVCFGDPVDKMKLIRGTREGEKSRLSPRCLI